MDRRHHWERVYRSSLPDEVSWFQPRAELSLELILASGLGPTAAIVDVGGGASRLAGDLHAEGFRNVAVLDLSSTALQASRRGLRGRSSGVTWIVGDALSTPFGQAALDLWHDRAVFHFLTDAADRRRYVDEVRRVVRPGGYVLVATFAADGPERCSGLSVARYGPDALHGVFDGGFALIAHRREVHRTPSGAPQPFTYCLCRHEPAGMGSGRFPV